MTPAQARTARELLGLTRERLAEMADVSVSTIADFETSRRSVSDGLLASIEVALEAAGIEFIPEHGRGSGVRLRKGYADGMANET